MNRHLLPGLVALAGLALVGVARGGPDAAPDAPATLAADAWLEHLRGCLGDAVGLASPISYEERHRLRPETLRERGRLVVARSGRARLELGGAKGRLVVADGRLVRAFDPGSRLVYEEPVADSLLDELSSLALGEEAGAGAFFVRRLHGPARPADGARAVIELAPVRFDAAVRQIVLTVEATCPAVRRVIITDHGLSLTRLELLAPTLLKKLDPTLFRLDRRFRGLPIRP